MKTKQILGLGTISILLCIGSHAQSPRTHLLPKRVPAPKDNPTTKNKIYLGKVLFFDTRLSVDGTMSCNSCHNIMGSGSDNRPVSAGIKGQLGERSAPTVFNAAYQSVQFWDGRASSLEEQAKGPITNPIEMGMKDHQVVVKRLRKIPGYRTLFQRAFGSKDPMTIDNVAKAIAAYERTLVTPNSAFDRFAKGKKNAISALAKQGYEKFRTTGCITCHNGPNFAGPLLPEGQGFYMKFPTIADTDYDDQYDFSDDLGRYEVTKRDRDKNFWRVPTLRNIAMTAPYFHNGAVQTLPEAVRVMAKTQLNKDLKPEDVRQIVAFLRTLTGRIPRQSMPVLPGTPGFSLTSAEPD